jgi:tRNA (pseudouridine54-N1)-methyltransferase
MRDFILRARKGPTTPDLAQVQPGDDRHLEVIAHCVVNALFTSRQARPDTAIHLALDGPVAPPKVIRFEGEALGSLPGLDEQSIWVVLRQALDAGRHLALGEEVQAIPGIFVAKKSFEQLVRERLAAGPVYALRPGGADLRSISFPASVGFILTDHLAMPRKVDRFLERLGAHPLSVGPTMLFASQCIAVVHNELDRQSGD